MSEREERQAALNALKHAAINNDLWNPFDQASWQGIELAVREIDSCLAEWADNAEFYGHKATYEGPPVDEEVRVLREIRQYLRDKESFPWSPLLEDEE